jgi:hypothetical protein
MRCLALCGITSARLAISVVAAAVVGMAAGAAVASAPTLRLRAD